MNMITVRHKDREWREKSGKRKLAKCNGLITILILMLLEKTKLWRFNFYVKNANHLNKEALKDECIW